MPELRRPQTLAKRRYLMRRLAKILGWLLAGTAVVLVTLPWWFGFALGGMAHALNTTAGHYERIGYARFALHDVVLKRSEVEVRVERIEADTPVLWSWRKLTGNPREIVGTHWSVTVPESGARPISPTVPKRESGWVPLHPRLRRIAAGLARWIPKATLGSGTVRWQSGGLAMQSVRWSDRTLVVKEIVSLIGSNPVPPPWPRADVEGTFPNDQDTIRAQLQDLVFGEVISVESRGADFTGDLVWAGQRAKLSAKFAATGWVPESGTAIASAWTVPGEKVKVGELYSAVRGDARIDWNGKKITVAMNAKGEPLAGKSAPPLTVDFAGHGDVQAMTLERVDVALPGITAKLNAPVTIGRDGKLQAGAARFSFAADLEKQPWFPAKGKVQGAVDVAPRAAAIPTADFVLNAQNIRLGEWGFVRAQTAGSFDWPKLTIKSATLMPVADEPLTAQGELNLQKKEITSAKFSGTVRRSWLAEWLPSLPQFQKVQIEAEASGPWAEISHSGKLQTDALTVSPFKPLAATGNWKGHGATIDEFNVNGKSGSSLVSGRGSITRDHLLLESFTLAQQGTERLHLSDPATVRWRPQVRVESLHLVGGKAALDGDLVWGQTGNIRVAAANLPSMWFTDLLPLSGPNWEVTQLAGAGNWNHGPLELSVRAEGTIELSATRRAEIALVAKADKNGLEVESLRAAEGTAPVVNATGKIGLTIIPGQSPLVKISPGSPVLLDAATEPNAAFWSELKELTGFELKDPQASAHLSGTWAKPRGEVKLQAARVAAEPDRFRWAFPTVENLDVHLTGDLAGVKLETFSVNVEGQAITASGHLAIKDGKWGELLTQPLLVARRDSDLQISIPDAQLAPLAKYLPNYLSPQGKLHAELKFSSGGNWDGRLTLRDAASRPLGPLGVLQEISADIRLVGYALELESVTAKAGGQPVTLTGKVEMPIDGPPRFDLALKGENLPFVRQTGLLMRGDVDLKLQTPENAAGRITGSVVLRDSLFLEDVRSMIPGGPRSGGKRPPYFSINTPPLDSWALDVDVRGQRFMRLRTTLFNGVVSARFRLLGTLSEPRAIGEVTIEQGQILLPFATFDVQQGRVSLSEAQPFEPQLYVSGTARRYGYDVRMELNGSASSPNIIFTSSPPLDSEQVLLMVMAGETPRNEITYSGNQRFARIGTFLGQSLLNNFGGDAAGADRLSIATGDKVSRQGRETYNIEYQFSPRWSVTGEYDEFDDYNAGFKWRFFSKGGKDDAK